jgi:hypothetical protein
MKPRVRVFHVFGDEKVKLGLSPVSVVREAVVGPQTGLKI